MEPVKDFSDFTGYYSSTEVSPRLERATGTPPEDFDAMVSADQRQLNESVRRLEEVTARLALSRTDDVESRLESSRARTSAVHALLANNNNAAPVQDAVEQGFIAHIKKISLSELVSYERTCEFFKANPLSVSLRSEITQNTALHHVIAAITELPYLVAPLSVFATVLLELGADCQAVNADGEMPIEIALRSENEMLVQLLTLEQPNKRGLLALAESCGHYELARWLQQETQGGNNNNAAAPVISVEQEGHRLAREISADPSQVYERIFAFYARHPQLLTRINEPTGNTQLHEAVLLFLTNELPGIFEVLVLLQQGADKEVKNKAGKTALELAEAAECTILIELLQQENPSKESLTMLALDHGLETLATWLTQ